MTFDDRLPIIGKHFNIEFTGSWSYRNMLIVLKAVFLTGIAFAATEGLSDPMLPWDAFNAVYGGMTFQWGECPECMGGGGYTYGAHLIGFASLSIYPERALHNVVHELGHAFDWIVKEVMGEGLMPRNLISGFWEVFRRSPPYTQRDKDYYGLAGPRNVRNWHQNPEGAAGEEFADTFLGWVFGAWEKDPFGDPTPEAQGRIDFMTRWMPMWVNVAAIY